MHNATIQEMIKRHEGFRNMPYNCSAGKLTIGFGRNLEVNGISYDEAQLMLDNDIDKCIVQLKLNFPVYNYLPDKIQHVLIDMCFNLGINGLMKFKRFLGYVKDGKYCSAAAEMMRSKWAEQTGSRAEELFNMVMECV